MNKFYSLFGIDLTVSVCGIDLTVSVCFCLLRARLSARRARNALCMSCLLVSVINGAVGVGVGVGVGIVADAGGGAVKRSSLLFRLARVGVELFTRSGETGTLLGGGSAAAVGALAMSASVSPKNFSVVAKCSL